MANTPAKKIIKKKTCPICGNEKSIATGFYKSSSPLFSLDGYVPICIQCVKDNVTNEDGTVNKDKPKTMCQRLDKPFYLDGLESAFLQSKKEHSYLPDSEAEKLGQEITGLYFKNINTLQQNNNKSFSDSEKDNFTHKTTNCGTKAREKKTAPVCTVVSGNGVFRGKGSKKQNTKTRWTEQDKKTSSMLLMS